MPIEFELTRDPHHLEQYYRLRETCFRRELGLADFDGSEEPVDRQGRILVALDNGRCIGGARISGNLPETRHLQPFNIATEACCIWERFVMDPGVRTVQLVRDFCAQLIDASRDSGFRHALVLSSLRNARFYRQCHSALGVPFEICGAVPDCAGQGFDHLEHYLSIANLHGVEPLQLAA